ncbi:MAG: peptidase domain-containing ABC transporter [Chitinophagales bacterium]|nr:peptidase domain-containing ABC transporter [Chitinophagales bacterium]
MSKKKLNVFQQQSKYDCGICCLLTIIQYYGGNETLENLRRLSGTNKTGTSLLGLYQAANACGFNAEGCEADMDALLAHPLPCILHVVLDNHLQHYVVYFGKKNQKGRKLLVIGDPAKGIVHLTAEELDKIWQSKACLILTPNDHFQLKSSIAARKRLWIKDLVKKDISLLSIAALLGIVIAALGLTMAIFSQKLIDEFIPEKQHTKLFTGVILVFLLLVAKETLGLVRAQLLLMQSKEFNLRIVEHFFSRLLFLPKTFFDTRKIGELTARLNDTTRIQRVISQLAGNTLLDTIVVLVTLVFIFSYSRISGYITVCCLPIFFLIIYLKNKKITEAQRKTMAGYALAESNYISSLQGVEAIKNHCKEKLYSEQNTSIYGSYQNAIFQLGQIQVRLSFSANTFAAILLCSLLAILSQQILNGALKAGELIAIIGMVGSLLPAVANLALLSIPINEAKIAFNRMFEFAGIEPDKLGTDHLTDFIRLDVQKVAFRYPGRGQILQNLSFSVQKGEIIALMGENGSGKSTLVQLLMQHYTPENGNIVINKAHQLSQVDASDWRGLVALVPQHVYIFNGTVIENIAFDDAANKMQDVLTFLDEYGFSPFINSLPQSFMTLVGEEGINLSGGQMQMIALARALYHRPQLLILDEATAAMDRVSEQFVLKLLQSLRYQMGIVFITHRLHVLKNFCDIIYVVEGGAVKHYGDHKTLLQTDNLYSRYWSDMEHMS